MKTALFTTLALLVAGTALAAIQTYNKVNSENGARICELSGTWCTTSAFNSLSLKRAVRSLAMTRHPNGGPNTWVSCGASNTNASCARNGQPTVKVGLWNCVPDGCASVCAFGTQTDGVRSIEGAVRVDVCADDHAQFYFDNGGVGQALFASNVFYYDGP